VAFGDGMPASAKWIREGILGKYESGRMKDEVKKPSAKKAIVKKTSVKKAVPAKKPSAKKVAKKALTGKTVKKANRK
jgi:hypothetical protein